MYCEHEGTCRQALPRNGERVNLYICTGRAIRKVSARFIAFIIPAKIVNDELKQFFIHFRISTFALSDKMTNKGFGREFDRVSQKLKRRKTYYEHLDSFNSFYGPQPGG